MPKDSLQIELDDLGRQLIIKIAENQELIEYQIEMLKHNTNAAILPFHKRMMNGQNELYYPVANMVPLKEKLEAGSSLRELLNILEEIIVTMMLSRDYLIYWQCFLLQIEYIFCEPLNGRIMLAYVPHKPDSWTNNSLDELIRQLTNTVQVGYCREDILILRTIKEYRRSEEISPEGLYKKLKEWKMLYNQQKYISPAAEMEGKRYKLSGDVAEIQEEIMQLSYWERCRNWPIGKYKKEFIIFVLIQGVLFFITSYFLSKVEENNPYAYLYGLLILTAVDLLIIKRLSTWRIKQNVDTEVPEGDANWKEALTMQLAQEHHVLRNEIKGMRNK